MVVKTPAGREISIRFRLSEIIQTPSYWDTVSSGLCSRKELIKLYEEAISGKSKLANMVEKAIFGAFREIAEKEVDENETQHQQTERID